MPRWAARMLLLGLLCSVAAVTEHTKKGGPCASLLELEEDYITRAESQIFNIVDPSTSVQCVQACENSTAHRPSLKLCNLLPAGARGRPARSACARASAAAVSPMMRSHCCHQTACLVLGRHVLSCL